MWRIIEPLWYKHDKHLAKTNIYREHRIPTIKPWIGKLNITHHIKQTKKPWRIRTPERNATNINEDGKKMVLPQTTTWELPRRNSRTTTISHATYI